MVISLIGMSGSGKTYWSQLLAQQGFLRFGCDDLIEELLSVELRKYGYRGIQDVAKWMGLPYESQYVHNSKKYLQYEKEVMESIFTILPALKSHNIVLDTTGSVIYTGVQLMKRLRKYTRIIYFSTPLVVQQQMYHQFLADPKPVLWGNVFSQRIDESDREALSRCYPLLLSSRSLLYQKYADVVLDYSFLRNESLEIHDFLHSIV